MSTEIRIARDQTVSAHWTGERGQGSLFQVMAGGNCDLANELGFDELLAIPILAKLLPFPVPGYTAPREKALAMLEKKGLVAQIFPPDHTIRTRSLGELRKAIVFECGDSCGGPTDGWLKWLAERKRSAVVA